MLVSAISTIDFKGRNYTTNINAEERKLHNIPQSEHSAASKAIPVIMLMAINPSLLNAKVNEIIPNTDSETKKEIVYTPREDIISPETIVPQSKITSYGPYGWAIFNNFNILYAAPAKCNGADYTMLFTSIESKDKVDYIYLVPKGQQGSKNKGDHPPEIRSLVYHNIGEGKEFVGANTTEDVIDKNGNSVAYMRREIRLDDSTAQKIIDLIAGKTKFKNDTYIKIIETDSPKLGPITTNKD